MMIYTIFNLNDYFLEIFIFKYNIIYIFVYTTNKKFFIFQF